MTELTLVEVRAVAPELASLARPSLPSPATPT